MKEKLEELLKLLNKAESLANTQAKSFAYTALMERGGQADKIRDFERKSYEQTGKEKAYAHAISAVNGIFRSILNDEAQ